MATYGSTARRRARRNTGAITFLACGHSKLFLTQIAADRTRLQHVVMMRAQMDPAARFGAPQAHAIACIGLGLLVELGTGKRWGRGQWLSDLLTDIIDYLLVKYAVQQWRMRVV